MLQTGTSWQKKAIGVSPIAGGPLVEKGSALMANITQLSFQQGCRGRQREQAEMEVTKSIAPHPQSWHDVKAEHDCSNTIAKLVLSQRDRIKSKVINSFSKTVSDQRETHIF